MKTIKILAALMLISITGCIAVYNAPGSSACIYRHEQTQNGTNVINTTVHDFGTATLEAVALKASASAVITGNKLATDNKINLNPPKRGTP